MGKFLVLAGFLAWLLVLGCTRAKETPTEDGKFEAHQLMLPKGDAVKGELAFRKLHCQVCHRVAGYDYQYPPDAPPLPIALGTGHTKTPTADYLFTAIVAPSHELATGFKEELTKAGHEVRMGSYSDVMTIDQLVNIVAFLRGAYKEQISKK